MSFLKIAKVSFAFLFVTQVFAETTPTGITLDQKWRETLYRFSTDSLKHPAWGLSHSERDYQIAKALLEESNISYDEEVLFAASFLHDLGGMDAFTVEGVDHAVRSAQLAEEKLPAMGFPVEKISEVKEIILGHTYYGPVPTSQMALAFRDADILDFLGAMGIARLYGATKDLDPNFSSLTPATSLIRKFYKEMPSKLSLPASSKLLEMKQKESQAFLQALDVSSFKGLAL